MSTHFDVWSVFFTEPTDSNANFIHIHPHRHTQKQCLAKDVGNPWQRAQDASY